MPDGHPLAGVDDPDLLDVLSRALAAATGSARVVAAQGRHSEWASSYEAEVVSLTLEGGERIRLFLKDFGVCCSPRSANAECASRAASASGSPWRGRS